MNLSYNYKYKFINDRQILVLWSKPVCAQKKTLERKKKYAKFQFAVS